MTAAKLGMTTMSEHNNTTTSDEESSDKECEKISDLKEAAVVQGTKYRVFSVDELAEEHNLDPDHMRKALVYVAFDEEQGLPRAVNELDNQITREDIPDEYPIQMLGIYIDKVVSTASSMVHYSDQSAEEYLEGVDIDSDVDDILQTEVSEQ